MGYRMANIRPLPVFLPPNHILRSKMYIEPSCLFLNLLLGCEAAKHGPIIAMSVTKQESKMAGFDESALKRLEELVSRSKAGPKLPPTEALELKELKLLKSAAEIAKGRAEIEVAKRKMKDREKYRVGGLAIEAGLGAWSDGDLKVAFAGLVARGNHSAVAHHDGELAEGPAGNEIRMQADLPAGVENASSTERLL
jgi:hypothetical protein